MDFGLAQPPVVVGVGLVEHLVVISQVFVLRERAVVVGVGRAPHAVEAVLADGHAAIHVFGGGHAFLFAQLAVVVGVGGLELLLPIIVEFAFGHVTVAVGV